MVLKGLSPVVDFQEDQDICHTSSHMFYYAKFSGCIFDVICSTLLNNLEVSQVLSSLLRWHLWHLIVSHFYRCSIFQSSLTYELTSECSMDSRDTLVSRNLEFLLAAILADHIFSDHVLNIHHPAMR